MIQKPEEFLEKELTSFRGSKEGRLVRKKGTDLFSPAHPDLERNNITASSDTRWKAAPSVITMNLRSSTAGMSEGLVIICGLETLTVRTRTIDQGSANRR